MAQNIHHFKNFSVVQDGVDIKLNLDRFSKQYNDAQMKLDNMVMTDMKPFMPHQDGTFIAITEGMSQAIAGTGKVIAAAPPEGRFLYEGKGMVDPATGSTWARKGAKKVLVSKYSGQTNAKENLVFSTKHNPKVQAHWFDAAKKADGDKWVKAVKQIAGGG